MNDDALYFSELLNTASDVTVGDAVLTAEELIRVHKDMVAAANTAVHEPEVINALALADTMDEMGNDKEAQIIRDVCKLVPPPMFPAYNPPRMSMGFFGQPILSHQPKAILTNPSA